jgi:elongator complex protein 1
LNLKEGNQFEDIAIIDALHTLIVKCCSVQQQNHLKDILEAAIDVNELEIASNLQKTFDDFLQAMKNSLDDIWLPEMMVSGQLQTGTAPIVDYNQVQNEQHYSMISKSKISIPLLCTYFFCFSTFPYCNVG